MMSATHNFVVTLSLDNVKNVQGLARRSRSLICIQYMYIATPDFEMSYEKYLHILKEEENEGFGYFHVFPPFFYFGSSV